MIKVREILIYFLLISEACYAKTEIKESLTLNGQVTTIKTDDIDFIKFQICRSLKCEDINFSQKNIYTINKNEFSKKFLHFTGDETVYLAFEYNGNNVNNCAIIFKYDQSKNEFLKTGLKDYEACNIKVRDDLLISSSRESATWLESAYKVKDGNITLHLIDKELDCNTFKRTEKINKLEEKISSNYLVDHNEKIEQRKILTANIVSKKSDIYLLSNIEAPTKKYLIAGDSIILTDYSYSETSGERYKMRFQGKNNITSGWIMSSTMKRNPPEKSCYP
jgi:hypothetical protein